MGQGQEDCTCWDGTHTCTYVYVIALALPLGLALDTDSILLSGGKQLPSRKHMKFLQLVKAFHEGEGKEASYV